MSDRPVRTTLWREPLLHFVVAGSALFALFALLGEQEARDDRILVTRSDVERLAETWRLQWERSPTEAELVRQLDAFVRVEVLYREAVAQGLGQGDAIIRRRLAQKMDFVLESMGDQSPPDDEELRRFLAAEPGRFRVDQDAPFPALDDVRDAVLTAYLLEQRLEAKRSAYADLRVRYEIEIEDPALHDQLVTMWSAGPDR